MSLRLCVLWLLCGAMLPVAVQAAAPKPISSVPFEIKVPGKYVLSRSVALKNTAALAAITISCDDVVLDLADWTIDCANGLAASGDIAGIRADGRKNITIRNGRIRGFTRGVYLFGNPAMGGHLVENVTVEKSTFLGIQVKGNDSIIRRNRVVSVGGSTLNTGVRYGIIVVGLTLRVVDNELNDLKPETPAQWMFGIYVEGGSTGSIIAGNRITGRQFTNGTGTVDGLAIINTVGVLIERNIFTHWLRGIAADSGSTGTYRDNTAVLCAQQYSTVFLSDGGGNQ